MIFGNLLLINIGGLSAFFFIMKKELSKYNIMNHCVDSISEYLSDSEWEIVHTCMTQKSYRHQEDFSRMCLSLVLGNNKNCFKLLAIMQKDISIAIKLLNQNIHIKNKASLLYYIGCLKNFQIFELAERTQDILYYSCLSFLKSSNVDVRTNIYIVLSKFYFHNKKKYRHLKKLFFNQINYEENIKHTAEGGNNSLSTLLTILTKMNGFGDSIYWYKYRAKSDNKNFKIYTNKIIKNNASLLYKEITNRSFGQYDARIFKKITLISIKKNFCKDKELQENILLRITKYKQFDLLKYIFYDCGFGIKEMISTLNKHQDIKNFIIEYKKDKFLSHL